MQLTILREYEISFYNSWFAGIAITFWLFMETPLCFFQLYFQLESSKGLKTLCYNSLFLEFICRKLMEYPKRIFGVSTLQLLQVFSCFPKGVAIATQFC